MQGRSQFTLNEASEIKRLLREKIRAEPAIQKTLRARLRKADFYITDFQADQSGFTEADFDYLVRAGTITIVDGTVAREPATGRETASKKTHEVDNDSSTADARLDIRRLRAEAAAKYRPDRVRILLVAEAPPNDPSRYFYFDDVAEHDSLFRYVAQGVLGIEPTRTTKPMLLERLKERGVFLIDLMDDPKVCNDHDAHVEQLVTKCRDLEPDAIILIKAPVFDAAYQRLKSADLPVIDVRMPFPGSGQQRKFEEDFRVALLKAQALP